MVIEKKKQEQGLLYNSNYDQKIVTLHIKTQELCYQYNHTLSFEKTKKDNFLQQILEKSKKGFLIEAPFHCDDGEQISIGERFYENDRLIILDAKVSFENDVFVGPNCAVFKAGRPVDYKTRNPVKIMKQLAHNDINKEVTL